jgi:hypothetical protein
MHALAASSNWYRPPRARRRNGAKLIFFDHGENHFQNSIRKMPYRRDGEPIATQAGLEALD